MEMTDMKMILDRVEKPNDIDGNLTVVACFNSIPISAMPENCTGDGSK
jgi:hypothetical protein